MGSGVLELGTTSLELGASAVDEAGVDDAAALSMLLAAADAEDIALELSTTLDELSAATSTEDAEDAAAGVGSAIED